MAYFILCTWHGLHYRNNKCYLRITFSLVKNNVVLNKEDKRHWPEPQQRTENREPKDAPFP